MLHVSIFSIVLSITYNKCVSSGVFHHRITINKTCSISAGDERTRPHLSVAAAAAGTMNPDSDEHHYHHHIMEEALRLARQAHANHEVPVGCVFMHASGEIIATGANLVNQTKNATRHAELICIDRVLGWCTERKLDWRIVCAGITVVVTVEPCIMCAAALIEVGVRKVVFGCRNDRFGGTTVLNVWQTLGSRCEVVGGVRADEAMELLKTFYKGTNPQAPVPKTRT